MTVESTISSRVKVDRGPRKVRYFLYAAALASVLGAMHSSQLGVYTDGAPGPGAWPTAILLVLTLLLLFQARADTGNEVESVSRWGAKRVAGAIGLLAVFSLLFLNIGLVTACLVFGTVWMTLYRDRSKGTITSSVVRSFVISACVAGILYVVIYRLLGAPIPVESILAGG